MGETKTHQGLGLDSLLSDWLPQTVSVDWALQVLLHNLGLSLRLPPVFNSNHTPEESLMLHFDFREILIYDLFILID